MTSTRMQRQERQVRNQARGLLWVSVLLLIACASMTGTFGWSLGTNLFSKLLFAGGLVGADLGGAYLMSTAGTCWANQERRAARWAAFSAMLCCALTLLGVLGFQSENREGTVQARERALKLGEGQIEWYRSLTAENTQARGKNGTANVGAMALGFEAVGKAVKEQIDRLQNGEVPATIDGQATTVARVLGTTEEKARSWLTMLTAGALLFIQYSCLWFYGFLRHKIEPAVGALVHGPLGPRKPGHFTDNVGKTDIQKARQDIVANVAAGIALSNGAYADRWNVSRSQVTKWQNIFVREGLMRKEWRGQEKVAVAPRMNGSGAHLKIVAPS